MSARKLLLLALFLTVLLAACSPDAEEPGQGEDIATAAIPVENEVGEEDPTEEPSPTSEPTEEPTQAPTLVPTTFPTDIPTNEPTAVPTEAPTETAEVAENCLGCHTDKEQLMETAAPEEKAPSESSGVG